MKQVIMGKIFGAGWVDSSPTLPKFADLRGTNIWGRYDIDANAAFRYSYPWSVAGTFKNLYAEIAAPVCNSGDLAWGDQPFTLYINGIATALTCTVPAAGPIAENGFQASATDTTHMVTIAPGDYVQIGRGSRDVTIGPNAAGPTCAWSLTFESDDEGESGYGCPFSQEGSSIGATNTAYTPAFSGTGAWTAITEGVGQSAHHSIVSAAGSIFRMDARISVAPGTGKHRSFALYKNAVLQDGSGGTVDTTVTISDAETTGFALFDLPVDVLDYVSLAQLVSTSPAGSCITASIGFRATTDGQSILCFNSAGSNPDNSGVTDFASAMFSGWGYTTAQAPTPAPAWRPARYPTTELLLALPAGIDTFTLRGFCVNLSTSPGADKSYLFTTRQAFADTASALTMTGASGIDSILFTDPDDGTVTFSAPTDYLDITGLATGTPAGTQVGWTWLMVESVQPPIVSTSYPIRRLRRFALPFDLNKWVFISRVELIMQAGNGLSGTVATQGYNPIVMFRLSRDGGATWDDELQMATGKIGEYTARAYLNRLGRARNPVVELTSSDPVFVSWIDFTVDYEEGTS